ncbi:hypothetical protein CJ232_09795 [Hoylesella timonensis]|uniref:Uncharacterized protein n=1 Tax=Hoylesella timonensis TaxID=386414 RepID=A0A2N6Q3R3_9BACT|nr:hypothetical protein CJ232_09795 [Hoylesella timonensis]
MLDGIVRLFLFSQSQRLTEMIDLNYLIMVIVPSFIYVFLFVFSKKMRKGLSFMNLVLGFVFLLSLILKYLV